MPKNVEITVQLDVRIVGINDASLDVQGGLKIHGTQDHWVKIDGVDLSPVLLGSAQESARDAWYYFAVPRYCALGASAATLANTASTASS